MKIAVTADVHLVPGDDGHPERLSALREILERLPGLGVDHLIIAGDLFDRAPQGYGEFDALCEQHPAVSIDVIPGNHDPNLADGHLVANNVTVHTQPQLVERDGRQVLFAPYIKGAKMGEVISDFGEELEKGRWILVGHGNYGGGLTTPDPREPGVYMPLSDRDITHSQPALVLLGHIHLPTDQPPVHYPGSPCGLDVSETGIRRFLVVDTEDATPTPHAIHSDVIFFSPNTSWCFPAAANPTVFEKRSPVASTPGRSTRTSASGFGFRIEAEGYCENRERIRDVLTEGFSDFTCHDGAPRVEKLSVNDNPNLVKLANRLRNRIDEIDWKWGDGEPRREDVLLAALAIVYQAELPS
ncbi:MAG: hypothetical protein Ct9H300mP1_15660 [Planctomycetaceae bacterium]|nr:MAG: hypothetical protein Ct9H300mP1_15660 [Planctomycetaceae bacterium]